MTQMRIPAEEIKERITMRDIFEKYGLHVDRRGFICCPFHREKTPSLGIYGDERRWHCFGCGESGDVIGFVQKYFDLSFNEAIQKIDVDFCLCLYKKPTLMQYRKMQQRDRELRLKREVFKQELSEAETARDKLCTEFRRLYLNKKEYAPKTPFEEWHPLYIEALRKLDYQEFLLERADRRVEVIKSERRKHRGYDDTGAAAK